MGEYLGREVPPFPASLDWPFPWDNEGLSSLCPSLLASRTPAKVRPLRGVTARLPPERTQLRGRAGRCGDNTDRAARLNPSQPPDLSASTRHSGGCQGRAEIVAAKRGVRAPARAGLAPSRARSGAAARREPGELRRPRDTAPLSSFRP